jgi:hypothetical protein
MRSYYAWTTMLADGSVSLVGAMLGSMHTPLCAMSKEIVMDPLMVELAQAHADKTGQTVFLERFDYAGTMDTLKPKA